MSSNFTVPAIACPEGKFTSAEHQLPHIYGVMLQRQSLVCALADPQTASAIKNAIPLKPLLLVNDPENASVRMVAP